MLSLSTQKGSALIVALVTLTLITMMSTVFFERVFRFSERSNGIENSNGAYYKALGNIEDALYTGGVNKYTPWNIKNGNTGSKSKTGSSITVGTGGTTIPIPGTGNSQYDRDYNIISLSEPVQIVIPEGISWGSVFFEFRVPTIAGNTNTGVAPLGMGSGYILWTLASSGASLFASGELNTFRGTNLNNINQLISGFEGTTNSGSTKQFGSFYTDAIYLNSGLPNTGECQNYKCTLKLSLIRPVPTTDSRNMTFLEYKISGFPTPIPSQYMDIHAEGYSYGFLRSRDIQFPQITTNTALDFAVLQ